jgi:alpha,alpha-trehalase
VLSFKFIIPRIALINFKITNYHLSANNLYCCFINKNMKKTLVLALILFAKLAISQTITWDKIYGDLFIDVQMQKIFNDSKTFMDCIPKRNPLDIMYDYGMMKGQNFDLKKFIENNFIEPAAPKVINNVMQEKNIATHIKNLWNVLKHKPDSANKNSSLLPLPYPYIVPGGRFREIYYWDSYFTMLGLKESNRIDLIENMINNFDYLIATFGHIPNGNRNYYLSRSQPPFFSLMVQLLASIKGNEVYKKYLPSLQKEYNYWMEGAAATKANFSNKRVVKLDNETVLNRYYDDLEIPRQEGYVQDVEVADKAIAIYTSTKRWSSAAAMKKAVDMERKKIYQNLRAAAASGWDFSSRWLADEENMETIETLNIVPVDLNCLILNLEEVLLKSYQLSDASNKNVASIQSNYTKRIACFQKYFWSSKHKFYVDYNINTKQQCNIVSAAGMYPFYFLKPNATNLLLSKGKLAVGTLKAKLLKPGGITSTPITTKLQWDAPNGWAPQQWMAIAALEKINQKETATTIAKRWIALNKSVYEKTGKLMEKYNVVDISLEAGGGEYPSQDGFGWTNGVLLALMKKYDTVTE